MALILEKLKTWWETADRNQKVVTLGGLTLLVFLMAGTFYFASKPKYALLFSGMNDADKNTVVTEIQTMGVPVKYDVPGQVEIPADRIGEVKMKLAGSGKLPKSAHPGIPDLDKMSLFSTPAQERERLKVILEGELAKSIESLESVQAARVHITLGDNSPFVSERTPPSASVSVTEAGGTGLSTDQGKAIATLVANACEGMSINNVTVLNQRMQFVFNGQDLADERTVANNLQDMQQRISKQKQREIQEALDRAFGPGTTIVQVQCELDLDQRRLNTRQETPSSEPLRVTRNSEKMEGDTVTTRSVSGAAANVQAPADGTAGDRNNSKYEQTSDEDQRALSVEELQSVKAPGTVRSMVINALVDSDRIADSESVTRYLAGFVSNRANDPINFPEPTVTPVKFDRTAANAAAQAQADAARQAQMQQMLSLVPVVALLLVAFMVVRQISKFTKPEPVQETALAVVEVDSPIAEEVPMSMEGDDALTLPSQQQLGQFDDPDALLAAIQAGHVSEHGYAAFEPIEIKDKVDLPLESLRKMADDRPHLLGQLIKSMLLEERR